MWKPAHSRNSKVVVVAPGEGALLGSSAQPRRKPLIRLELSVERHPFNPTISKNTLKLVSDVSLVCFES